MGSPLQEPEDSTSSSICGVPILSRELATELVAEIRGQAQDDARADSVLRIENERLTEELSATAEAKVVAAAVARHPLALPVRRGQDNPKQVSLVSTPLGQKAALRSFLNYLHTRSSTTIANGSKGEDKFPSLF